MTTPSPLGGSEPTRPPSPETDEEPLPSAGENPAGDDIPLTRLSADPSAKAGKSFAADFSRHHYFSGFRLLKPGRRVAIAVAGVTGLAVVGVGVAAGVSQLGGDDTAKAAATVRSTDVASTPSGHGSSTASGPASHAPSGTPKPDAPGKKGGPSAQDVLSGLPGQSAPPPQSASGGSGADGKSTVPGTGTGTGTGTGSGTTGGGTQHSAPPPKSTGTSPGFTGGLVLNFAANRCLATQGGSRAAGTQLVLADCNSGDPSQGWTFPSDGTARNFGGTMCLDVSNPYNGALVKLAKCSSSRAENQRFTLKGSYDLVDMAPDLCVDAKDKNTAAGTDLQLWECTGTSNQKWRNA
ncbi:ricin-type beta-trefoil lectin domain protein [Streptomyces sp. NPDC006012]|uniref:ricin-type beta-trefoil lectin domain protein n=1 Tax=Streptomyces sp. NPDC006012 TaxID=3364739 RepID=UPI003689B0DD